MGVDCRFLLSNEPWELSTLAHKLKNIIDHVKEKLLLCSSEIRKPLSSFIPCYFLFFWLAKLYRVIVTDHVNPIKMTIYIYIKH
jgi:hypothetical protein